MNRLSNEKSAYLRHAAHQKIDWFSWSEEPFEKAKREDKPVFLSTGAVWCHWCHVMARESFENDDIAALLNESFVCIKLDRDERPDIDRRYQQAVAAMGNGSGWPLSVFLMPDKKPFFGGTYFPPVDSHGRPGFLSVLRSVADFYRNRRDEVSDYGQRLVDYLRPGKAEPGELAKALVDRGEHMVLAELDSSNGGFGSSPKFPMPAAVGFLVNRYFATQKGEAGSAIRKTLEAMARGGFHDQLGGGFHRYSTDEAWIVPHFEKMAEDNASLLEVYVSACAVFEDPGFREVAEGIIGFVRKELSDPLGGFYASQDADVTPDDEGGYFTWNDEEIRAVLSDEEYRVALLRFTGEKGAMPHDEARKVLYIARETEEISETTGLNTGKVTELVRSARRKMLEAREERTRPFVDRTMYTSLNGMFASAYLSAFRIMKDEYLRRFALSSLERVLKENLEEGVLYHCPGVRAVLDDYIFLADAMLGAYEVTADSVWLSRTDDMMELCLHRLWDGESGGFFDSEDAVLGIRLRTLDDVGHPSANARGIMLLLKLYFITKKDRYYELAETALKAFSGRAIELGLHAASYFCALEAYYRMVLLTVEALPQSELAEAALSFFVPYKAVLYAPSRDGGTVTPCISGVCLEPVSDAGDLINFLKKPA